jgi:hypothetical protein
MSGHLDRPALSARAERERRATVTQRLCAWFAVVYLTWLTAPWYVIVPLIALAAGPPLARAYRRRNR